MRKRPAQVIPYNHFHRMGSQEPHHGLPPSSQETALDRFFTTLAHVSGLHRYARKELVRRIERIEATASHLKATARIQHYHQQLNILVDGGWLGLWTSIRVSLGAA